MLSLPAFALLGLAALVQPSAAGFTLQDDYSGDKFFSGFNFFTGPDPTHGCVDYKDEAAAKQDSLIGQTGSSIFMGVDNTTKLATGAGRPSVRLESTKTYNQGLFIIDASHMPVGCGVWPAFWLVGPNWPMSGEIDIIEGVSMQTSNSMTLHTGGGCTLDQSPMTGSLIHATCLSSGSDNQGCGISAASSANSYGQGFNSAQGGVYATQWDADAIKIWFFTRSAIPADIASGSPDPSSWGLPTAMFQGQCDMASEFKDMQIVFDTTFCGDWAGNAFGQDSECAAHGQGLGACSAYVEGNPGDFNEAYWTVNSVKVYAGSGAASSPTGGSPYAPSSTVGLLPTSTAAAPLLGISASLGLDLGPAATSSSAAAAVQASQSPEPVHWGSYGLGGGDDGAKAAAQQSSSASSSSSSSSSPTLIVPTAAASTAPPAAPNTNTGAEAVVVGADGMLQEMPAAKRGDHVRRHGAERRHLGAHQHRRGHRH